MHTKDPGQHPNKSRPTEDHTAWKISHPNEGFIHEMASDERKLIMIIIIIIIIIIVIRRRRRNRRKRKRRRRGTRRKGRGRRTIVGKQVKISNDNDEKTKLL